MIDVVCKLQLMQLLMVVSMVATAKICRYSMDVYRDQIVCIVLQSRGRLRELTTGLTVDRIFFQDINGFIFNFIFRLLSRELYQSRLILLEINKFVLSQTLFAAAITSSI